jgi:hypothetical protein
MNNLLDIKENDEYALDFALHLSPIFSFSASLDLPCTAHAFFPELLSNHYQGLRHISSEICIKLYVVALLDLSRNRIKQDA